MKVVKQKSTGKIVYRELPEFKKGNGINNASLIEKISKDDLEEAEVTQEEWDSHLKQKQEKEFSEIPENIQNALDLLFDYIKGDKPIPADKTAMKEELKVSLKTLSDSNFEKATALKAKVKG